MLSILSNTIRAYTSTGSAFISEIEQQNSKNQAFFKEIQTWRNLELNYISRVHQIANNLREKSYKPILKDPAKENIDLLGEGEQIEEQKYCANFQLSKILQIIIDNHKSFLSKINFDIFLVNYDMSQKLLALSKKLLDEQKQEQKEINNKKDLLQKVLSKKQKLKKQREQEMILQIFMSDSVDTTMDQKIRKKNKIKDLQKEMDEYDLKVKETVEDYRKLHEKNKQTILNIKSNYKEQNRCKNQTLLKVQLHLSTYWKNLIGQMEEQAALHKEINYNNSMIFDRFQKKEDQVINKLTLPKGSFMDSSLRIINDNSIDELIDYSRDRDVKSKIKRMMESNQVNPAETDETSRQVKLIKKMLGQQLIVETDCLAFFKNIINKNSKLRMNFVFILQFFRLNNQFQINVTQMKPLHCLISQFLQSCYDNRDSFVLKQLMVLLMTYYVSHPKKQGQCQKIYIIHFFKRDVLWKDLQYWESVLVECIYLQRRNTIKMMLVNESNNSHRRKQLLQAERSAILNQVLMVVRNMIIFEFSEKEVKTFANRFIKLLKQDQKFQKDVNSTIQEAVKQELKLHLQQKEYIKQFYCINFIKQKSEQNHVPLNVRRSYIM